jgi:hypothetical protein
VTTVVDLDRLWGWFLIGGSVVWAIYCLRVWRRGWIYDDEDDTIRYRKDHPWSWRFLQAIHVLSFGAILYPGLASLNGWWR